MWWNCATKHLELGGMLLLMATSAQSIRPQPGFPLSSQCCSAKMRACFQAKLCCLLNQGEPHQWKTLWARWNKFLVLATLRLSYEKAIPVSCFYTFPCSGVQGVPFSPRHPVTGLILLPRTSVDYEQLQKSSNSMAISVTVCIHVQMNQGHYCSDSSVKLCCLQIVNICR